MEQLELDAIIQSGEGYFVEFKRSVNSDLSKEIVAFANSSGGRILIGVEDDGSITGATLDNSLRSKIESTANDCDPSIKVFIETAGAVIIIIVPNGPNKPYRNTNGFYTRNGATSMKLATHEIIDFIKAEGKVKFEELVVNDFDYQNELDKSAIKGYFEMAHVSTVTSSQDILVNLGVAIREREIVFNNAGILFFAKEPKNFIPQSVVTCVAYKGNSKVDIIDRKDFSFGLISNIEEVISFLKRQLNVSYEIKGIRRKETLEIPEVVLREAVINAVAHRDYFEKGANVMVEVFDNRVEITNPGGLIKGLSPAQFGTRTLARNPLIAALLNRAGYIEKLGTGIPRIRREMAEAKLPEPVFHFDGFFSVALRRYNLLSALQQDLEIVGKKAERVAFLLRQLAITGELNVEEASNHLQATARTLRNDLDYLAIKGWVTASGSTKGRNYELTELSKGKLGRYL